MENGRNTKWEKEEEGRAGGKTRNIKRKDVLEDQLFASLQMVMG